MEGTWKETGRRAEVEGTLEGVWYPSDGEGSSDEEHKECSGQGSRDRERTYHALNDMLDKSAVMLEHLEEELGTREAQVTRPRELSGSREMGKLGAQPRVEYHYPVVAAGGGRDRYKPYKVGDVQAIIDKLPQYRREEANGWDR